MAKEVKKKGKMDERVQKLFDKYETMCEDADKVKGKEREDKIHKAVAWYKESLERIYPKPRKHEFPNLTMNVSKLGGVLDGKKKK